MLTPSRYEASDTRLRAVGLLRQDALSLAGITVASRQPRRLTLVSREAEWRQ
jgi:hypothetical protein